LRSVAPLVCVPGTLCDERVFAPILARLPLRETVHAHPLNADSVGMAAEALLRAAPPRFVIMGFSLGGFVAIEAMRRAPGRIVGAVMISSNAHPDAAQNAAARRAQVDLARDRGVSPLVDILWPGYVAQKSMPCRDLKSVVLAMAEAVGVEALAAQAEIAIGRPDRRDWAARHDTPMLVICGAEDALCPLERYQTLASSPAANLVIIPGAGHFAPLEAPDKTAAAISDWLETLAEVEPASIEIPCRSC
jgi:pimeloyl-ACP methyl ester carboxylesterase